MEVFYVSNSSSTSLEFPSQFEYGLDFAKRPLETVIDLVLLISIVVGMGGNVLLFKVTNFMVQKKKEAG